MRCLISKSLNISNKDIIFRKTEFGKPYIYNYPSFRFNISHTKNAILVGISEKSIGVDIEKAMLFDLKIADRFFTSDEREYVYSKVEHVCERFFEVWTKKEAYIKYVGKGMSISLNFFSVLDNDIKDMIFTTRIKKYVVSVCSSRDTLDSLEIITLDEMDIYNMAEKFLK